jgi:hypothetical protein
MALRLGFVFSVALFSNASLALGVEFQPHSRPILDSRRLPDSGTEPESVPGAHLKLRHQAPYPFTCYGGFIEADVGREFIEGKIVALYYGYTNASADEFEKTADLPWFKADGKPGAEGKLEVLYRHDGGYKGSMILPELFIAVPPGKNLVFRLGYLKKIGGDCFRRPDELPTQYTESRVFFVRMD